MSLGILTSTLQALRGLKNHPYIHYIGTNLPNNIANAVKLKGDYSYLGQRKSRLQLIRISAAVCGIELCYAAETAFVSPILLKLGVPVAYMTLVWCLSPFLGFFLVPLFGSLSDRCRLSMGRRRPFIMLLSVGIILGLILVPHGERIGVFLKDGVRNSSFTYDSEESPLNISRSTNISGYTNDTSGNESDMPTHHGDHVKGIVLTVIGVALLDFNCDACQSPCRAYLLDVSIPGDHSPGLTTFTLMAGLGGTLGYIMGGINWNAISYDGKFDSHIRIVFTIVLFIFIICLISTVTSFREIPLPELALIEENELPVIKKKVGKSKYRQFTNEEDDDDEYDLANNYGTLSAGGTGMEHDQTASIPPLTNGQGHNGYDVTSNEQVEHEKQFEKIVISTDVTLKSYLLSIVNMPRSLLILCITNLFCWMSLVCYSLYFTDFVGQVVFNGDPQASPDSPERDLYEQGVRLGSFGMSLYSFSCAVYSLCIDYLIQRFRPKTVYICGQLIYTIGMIVMAISRSKVAVLVMSPTAGIMYATLFTMPYLLVAHYHTKGMFTEGGQSPGRYPRGLGTDVALVSSMVFLAQFLLSICMGSIISAAGSSTAVVVAAALLSFFGAITATQVIYMDL